ncbi:amidohydrolase [Micrococcus sp. IITD107]|uniref:amidohydrolase n=1 Tax=Micrococcus sp. IITD107 TaxID=3342790 RepID=UPI0035B6C685
MHGCGHDVHVAALISAAQWMSDHRDQWAGTFIALFQPAEEQGAGAQSMVDAGLTELAPRPDIAFAQHVLALPAGQLGVRPGPFYSTAANLRITVHGEGGHGSAPHLTVDPVVLAAAIVGRLQTIVSRELPPGEFAVVTVGQIIAGTQSNIIADRAVMELNLRTYSEETEAQVLAAIDRIVRGECAAAGSPKEPGSREPLPLLRTGARADSAGRRRGDYRGRAGLAGLSGQARRFSPSGAAHP